MCSPHKGAHLECPAWVTREVVPLDPTEYLLHKATLPSLQNTAALLNRSKHKEAAKIRRQRNMCQIKDQNSRKRTKQNGDKQSTRYRVQNPGYKDAQ